MILQKLTLFNFRQFKGQQELLFSDPTGEGKNVIVVYGENGRGKTGIFRGVMFCLYGDHRLLQDEDIDKEELFLINTPALDEADNNKPVSSFVELEFLHKGQKYLLKRSLFGLKNGDERIEQLSGVEFYQVDEYGNSKLIDDVDEVERVISSVLDKKVKDYFLFDGEKIQKLTLASAEQKKEVAKGIKNLLNIDSLEKAKKSISKVKNGLNKELEKKATGEYGKVIKEIVNVEEKIEKNTERIKELEKEYGIAEKQKSNIDKELEKYAEIREILKERHNKEQELEDLASKERLILSQIKDRIGRSSLLLMTNTVDSVFQTLDHKIEKGELPSEIRKDLIERIIKDKKCICGNEVEPGSDAFQEIIKWKNKSKELDVERSAMELWRSLSGIRDSRENIAEAMESALQKHGLCRNNIEKVRTRIEAINEIIGSDEKKDISKDEQVREKIVKDLHLNENQRDLLEQTNGSLSEDLTRLRGKKETLEKEENIKNELSQRVELADRACAALSCIYNDFTEEIKEKIAEEANFFLEQLLDDEGRETLKKIIVNNDYSLQILDKWGRHFLANISAGQRQVMSIAFISALAKVAAGDNILEIPLFMDTPFGRLSLEHRKKLVLTIPHNCAQWVLLATDTEFRKQEAELLREGGKWCRFYHLKSGGAGITKIQERSLTETDALLKEELEVGQ